MRRTIRAGGHERGLRLLYGQMRGGLLAVLVVGPAGQAEQREDEDDDYGYEDVAFHEWVTLGILYAWRGCKIRWISGR